MTGFVMTTFGGVLVCWPYLGRKAIMQQQIMRLAKITDSILSCILIKLFQHQALSISFATRLADLVDASIPQLRLSA